MPSWMRRRRRNSLGACSFSSAVENEKNSVFAPSDLLEQGGGGQRAGDDRQQHLLVRVDRAQRLGGRGPIAGWAGSIV